MSIPFIPTQQYIPTSSIERNTSFGNLRIIRADQDQQAREHYANLKYEFQHEGEKRHQLRATVGLKGAISDPRLTAMLHLSLGKFREIVRYDPSNPPLEDYDALGMKEAHEQTQADFKGAKKENLANFKQYILEAIRGERVAYLPPISGWQSETVFDQTIFVAFDQPTPTTLYGDLWLPKRPVMQADGQTQTAALFQAAATGVAEKSKVLDTFGVTVEIELNVSRMNAGQSFADRNGRGAKKNLNLVKVLDASSPIARLRSRAIDGTIFAGRLADGRTTGTTETATENIVDLSTLDQMLLAVVSKGTKKPEQIKHHHINTLVPYCREFLRLLEDCFGAQWPAKTPSQSEPYRRLYVHGWPFCLKALANAYYESRSNELEPINAALGVRHREDHLSVDEARDLFEKEIAISRDSTEEPSVNLAELKQRLAQIDWYRYRRHWIALTGYKLDAITGSKKTRALKGGGQVVEALAPNTAAVINAVAAKIMSPQWAQLCGSENEPIIS